MKVFLHHIYEYHKGLRGLILYTGSAECLPFMEAKLKKNNIDYLVCPISENKANVFFGHSLCVEIVKRIGYRNLAWLKPEEDFILGIMLGYDRIKQCERYLKRKGNSSVAQQRQERRTFGSLQA